MALRGYVDLQARSQSPTASRSPLYTRGPLLGGADTKKAPLEGSSRRKAGEGWPWDAYALSGHPSVSFADRADCQSSATPVKKTSAGVFQSRHFLGRLFNKAITLSRSSSEITRKSQPFGKKKRSRPFVFSFVPLCHGA